MATIDDVSALEKVGDRLFDYPIKPKRAREFLNDSRHHLVLAYHQKEIVGMASAIHYVHPDKNPTLFINEVSVLNDFQNKGIGRSLVKFMVDHGKYLGCTEAWVVTENSNKAARRAYVAAGGSEDEESVILIEFKS
ncbi:MAG TPA: GNAT family N-acetyltransferase, partial [Pricia sp.]|nr:GNAT family N-acetyltransferase [Pricia sp.]